MSGRGCRTGLGQGGLVALQERRHQRVALVALIFLLHGSVQRCSHGLRPLLDVTLGAGSWIPPAASFLITLTFVTSTSHGQGVRYTLPWFPALGVNFSLWIDGLSVFFALLIAGMGLLITWYSHYYLDPSERQAVSTPTCCASWGRCSGSCCRQTCSPSSCSGS